MGEESNSGGAATIARGSASAGGRETVDYDVVVIGAGLGGIGAAIALQREKITDVLIVDKWPSLGGTWFANVYPGVAVDVPFPAYSFSFAPAVHWSRLFPPGAEVRDYLEQLVVRYRLNDRVKCSVTVVRAEFDEQNGLWRIGTSDGREIRCRYVVDATGALEQPNIPRIDGLDSFAGVVMHTARWKAGWKPEGRRVALIGTGASAVQLLPALARRCAAVTVVQRSPPWVLPRVDLRIGRPLAQLVALRPVRVVLRVALAAAIEAVFAGGITFRRRVDRLMRIVERLLRSWMRSQVRDPVTRERLTPAYAFGCKRPAMSGDYLRCFNSESVRLETEQVVRVTKNAVELGDGRCLPVDTIVLATGFRVLTRDVAPPFPVLGIGGCDLGRYWDRAGYAAYQGVTVPGFPNYFLIGGPLAFTPGSYTWMVEATARHAARMIAATRSRGATTCEVSQVAFDRYVAVCRSRSARTAILDGTCEGVNSYYLDPHGLPSVFRPSSHLEMWWQNRRAHRAHYRIR